MSFVDARRRARASTRETVCVTTRDVDARADATTTARAWENFGKHEDARARGDGGARGVGVDVRRGRERGWIYVS